MIPGSLNARRRETELAELASGRVVDILVIGGGVTGAGIALDAASRGLSVALIEARDLAFGTSRWSSKLVHGGLRYLAGGEFTLAHESAVERGILMTTTAPHLTRTLGQLFPLYPSTSRAHQAFVGAGLRAGDGLRRAARTPSALLPRPRTISGPEGRALAPGLAPEGLRGGLLSFDGALTDDARLVIALARTAASLGARVLTRVSATHVSHDEVGARDELTGESITLRAGKVINATGVWARDLVPSVRLRPSRGSHLVLAPGTARMSETAILVPVAGSSNRFVFLLPQPDGKTYLGLTDQPLAGEPADVPDVPQGDSDFLLEAASTVLTTKLTSADVVGSFAGLRPLIETDNRGRGADLSRKHAILTSADGVITAVGGKLTTYRKMAEDAVDAALGTLGKPVTASTTARLPLLGAAPRHRLYTVEASERLVRKYGTEAARVAALGELDPELAEPVSERSETTAAEVVWAVRHEGAMNVDDVLHRRTRIGLVAAEAQAATAALSDLVKRTVIGLGVAEDRPC